MKADYSNFNSIVATSFSYAEVLRKLGLRTAGGNYATIREKIKQEGISISHFKKSWNKGKKTGPRRTLEEYLSNKAPAKSYRLKERLIKEEVFKRKCNRCKRTSWNALPIPLELEHKDGNSKNNNLANLEILCPNCHAQTPTYRRRK